jgi:hypothetical protein
MMSMLMFKQMVKEMKVNLVAMNRLMMTMMKMTMRMMMKLSTILLKALTQKKHF